MFGKKCLHFHGYFVYLRRFLYKIHVFGVIFTIPLDEIIFPLYGMRKEMSWISSYYVNYLSDLRI